MGPATHVVWIVEKPRNAGNLAQQAKKLRLLEHAIEPAIGRTQLPQVFMHGLAAHLPELVTGLLGIKARKFLDQSPAVFRNQQLIDHDVTKRLGGLELVSKVVNSLEDNGVDQLQHQTYLSSCSARRPTFQSLVKASRARLLRFPGA